MLVTMKHFPYWNSKIDMTREQYGEIWDLDQAEKAQSVKAMSLHYPGIIK